MEYESLNAASVLTTEAVSGTDEYKSSSIFAAFIVNQFLMRSWRQNKIKRFVARF